MFHNPDLSEFQGGLNDKGEAPPALCRSFRLKTHCNGFGTSANKKAYISGSPLQARGDSALREKKNDIAFVGKMT